MSKSSIIQQAAPGSELLSSSLMPDQDMELHEANGGCNTRDPGFQQRDAGNMDSDGITGRKLKGAKWFIVITAILSSTFLYALDNTVTANVRPTMIAALGNRIDMLPWLTVSYPLGEIGMNPLWGKLNKYFDNKLLYLAAVFIFEVGSAVCGSAQSIEAVIAARAIAGAGGSGIYVGTMNMVSIMTVETERTNYLNFVGITWCLGTILGPAVGGAFADSAATWRWAFYLNICIAALAAPAYIFLIPSTSPSKKPLWERVKRVDYIGAALFLGGVVSIIMILGFGGALYDWNSGQMIGLYVAAPVIWIAFCIQQRFSLFTADRIFPAQFVGDWEMAIFFSWGSLAIANVVVTVYSLPLIFQFVYGDSSLRSAAYTVPYVCACVAVGGITGPVIIKYPIYKPWFTGASILMLIGNGLLTTIDYSTSRGAMVGYSVISGVGCGPIMQLGYTAAQSKVVRRHSGNNTWALSEVTGFMSCSQMSGLALSLGIATTLFLNLATNEIATILPSDSRELIQATIGGVGTDLIQGLSPAVRLAVLEAIAKNAAKVFYLNVAGAGLGFLTSLLMKRERLILDAQAPKIEDRDMAERNGGVESGTGS